jgi:AraC-like DNA-binding protein
VTPNVEPFRVRPLRETARVSLTRFDHPSGARLPTAFSAHEAAEQFRINVVERGTFRLKQGRRDWTLGAGSIFLSRPGDEYRYAHLRHVEADTCLVVGFSASAAGELESVFQRLPLVLPATNRLAFLRLQLSSLTSRDPELALDTVAYECVDAARKSGDDRRHLYRSEQLRWYAQRINAARELMDADPAAQLSLHQLSSAVAMSPFRFAHVFRELVGMPPHKYLIGRRLLRARDLLRSGRSVTDVCYTVGFNNLSHFIRSFRRHFGVVPSHAGGKPCL